MKSKHISEPFLESARAGGGGGASSRAAAARLLYCARGRTLLLSHLGNLHSSCSSSQMTAAPRVHAGVWADRRREGQREPCKTGTQLILWITGTGCSIRIPPSRHGQLCRSLPSHRDIPGREDTKQVTLLQEHLI